MLCCAVLHCAGLHAVADSLCALWTCPVVWVVCDVLSGLNTTSDPRYEVVYRAVPCWYYTEIADGRARIKQFLEQTLGAATPPALPLPALPAASAVSAQRMASSLEWQEVEKLTALCERLELEVRDTLRTTDLTVQPVSAALNTARTSACAAHGQCQVAAVGVGACGGARAFLPFCAAATNTRALNAKLRLLSSAERKRNALLTQLQSGAEAPADCTPLSPLQVEWVESARACAPVAGSGGSGGRSLPERYAQLDVSEYCSPGLRGTLIDTDQEYPERKLRPCAEPDPLQRFRTE
jgi:hypothetical protein